MEVIKRHLIGSLSDYSGKSSESGSATGWLERQPRSSNHPPSLGQSFGGQADMTGRRSGRTDVGAWERGSVGAWERGSVSGCGSVGVSGSADFGETGSRRMRV